MSELPTWRLPPSALGACRGCSPYGRPPEPTRGDQKPHGTVEGSCDLTPATYEAPSEHTSRLKEKSKQRQSLEVSRTSLPKFVADSQRQLNQQKHLHVFSGERVIEKLRNTAILVFRSRD